MNLLVRPLRSILAIAGALLILSSIVYAQSDEEQDKNFLLMYFKEKELVVESPTRGKKPITQVAENVSVVTAEDIKLMNAHTLSDVLNMVTGVQVFTAGSPAGKGIAAIQGSEQRHVSVFMDGIPLNNLTDNITDVGSIPVQNIEKVEIIKGPASSSWGSAIGGVINIITKSGSEGSSSGMASISYGERNTSDLRLETSGKQNRLGYYVTAGSLQTDGFKGLHHEAADNNAYAKLSYDLTDDTTAVMTTGHRKVERGDTQIPEFDLFVDNQLEIWTSSFALNSRLNNDAELDFSFWHLHQEDKTFFNQLSSGAQLSGQRVIDEGYGGSAKLTWKLGSQNFVVGSDFNSKRVTSDLIADGEKKLRQTALFINDTISIGHLSLTPGVRYDDTNTNGEFTSPSLGATYKLTNTTLLRAYSAKAFNLPPLGATYGDNIFHQSNPNLKMEEVMSNEAGLETTAVSHLWMKLSFFQHDIKSGITSSSTSDSTFTTINAGKERRQGMEIELKTEPVLHTSLFAGAAFMSAKDPDSGQAIPDLPTKTYDIGLRYDDDWVRALINGHYIDWNSSSDPAFNGKYDSFIVDLHAAYKLRAGDRPMEVFSDIHNMFNASQYFADVYKNPGRWVEAGIRSMF